MARRFAPPFGSSSAGKSLIALNSSSDRTALEKTNLKSGADIALSRPSRPGILGFDGRVTAGGWLWGCGVDDLDVCADFSFSFSFSLPFLLADSSVLLGFV